MSGSAAPVTLEKEGGFVGVPSPYRSGRIPVCGNGWGGDRERLNALVTALRVPLTLQGSATAATPPGLLRSARWLRAQFRRAPPAAAAFGPPPTHRPRQSPPAAKSGLPSTTDHRKRRASPRPSDSGATSPAHSPALRFPGEQGPDLCQIRDKDCKRHRQHPSLLTMAQRRPRAP